MSVIQDTSALRGRPADWVALASASLIVAGGLLMQATTYLNQDIAWIIYSAAQMLDGAVFGREIIEPNPPLAWLLAMPAAAAWKFLAIAPDPSYRLMVAGLAVAVMAHVYCRVRDGRSGEARTQSDLLLVVLAYYLFVGCYRDYGQREYLCLALALPYLFLASARIEGGAVRPSVALVVGAAAGLGFAIKPYFLAVPLFVEVGVALRTRRPRLLLRREVLVMAAVIGAYVPALLLLSPDYVNEVVPLVRTVYWAFEGGFGTVVLPAVIDTLGLAAAAYLYVARNRSPLQTVLLAASAGFLLSYLLQSKGYSYHLFPLRALVATSLVLHLGSLLRAPRRGRAGPLLLACLAVALVLISNFVFAALWYVDAKKGSGSLAVQTEDVIRVVDQHASGRGFLALATHPFPGFPTAIYSQARWVSRTNGTWLVPAIAKLRAGAAGDRLQLAQIERTAWDMLRQELSMAAPALVLVDAREGRHALEDLDFDILAFYLEDRAIRELWQAYVELAPVQGFRVFVRNGEVPQ